MFTVEGGPLGEPPVILYTLKWRMYKLIINNDPGNQWILNYCPFCGKKFPDNLMDAYYYAIRDDTGKVLDPLPKEFETDEWWKKRGL